MWQVVGYQRWRGGAVNWVGLKGRCRLPTRRAPTRDAPTRVLQQVSVRGDDETDGFIEVCENGDPNRPVVPGSWSGKTRILTAM